MAVSENKEPVRCAANADDIISVFTYPSEYHISAMFMRHEDALIILSPKVVELRTTNITRDAGPDNLSSFLLTHEALDVTDVFTSLIKTSLSIFAIPDCFRPVTIVPISKSGMFTALN